MQADVILNEPPMRASPPPYAPKAEHKIKQIYLF